MPLRPPLFNAGSLQHYCFTCRYRKAGGCTNSGDPKEKVDDLHWCGWHTLKTARPPVVIKRWRWASLPQPTEAHVELVYIGGRPARVAAWQLRSLSREHRV